MRGSLAEKACKSCAGGLAASACAAAAGFGLARSLAHGQEAGLALVQIEQEGDALGIVAVGFFAAAGFVGLVHGGMVRGSYRSARPGK